MVWNPVRDNIFLLTGFQSDHGGTVSYLSLGTQPKLPGLRRGGMIEGYEGCTYGGY